MRIAVILAVLSLAACASPCPTPETAPTSATFACEDGSTMHVTFTHSPERALVEQKLSLEEIYRGPVSGSALAKPSRTLGGEQANWTRGDQ